MPGDLTETLDAAFAARIASPLGERGYRVGKRYARRRVNDLYLWLQLFGDGRGVGNVRYFELRGGVAVEACLPFTRSPAKPWQWSQVTLWWQSVMFEYAPGGDRVAEDWYLTSFEHLNAALDRETDRFVREVDELFSVSADVREVLWEEFVEGRDRIAADPRQGPEHLAVLLAAVGERDRLNVVLHTLPVGDALAAALKTD